MNAKPKKTFIFVEVTVSELVKTKKTESGLHIPDTAVQELSPRSDRGVIVAVGDLVTEYHVGETVLFGRNAGVETEIEGKKYLVMDQSVIMATL